MKVKAYNFTDGWSSVEFNYTEMGVDYKTNLQKLGFYLEDSIPDNSIDGTEIFALSEDSSFEYKFLVLVAFGDRFIEVLVKGQFNLFHLLNYFAPLIQLSISRNILTNVEATGDRIREFAENYERNI